MNTENCQVGARTAPTDETTEHYKIAQVTLKNPDLLLISSVEKPALKRGSAVRRDMFIAKIHLPTAKLR